MAVRLAPSRTSSWNAGTTTDTKGEATAFAPPFRLRARVLALDPAGSGGSSPRIAREPLRRQRGDIYPHDRLRERLLRLLEVEVGRWRLQQALDFFLLRLRTADVDRLTALGELGEDRHPVR